MHSNKILLIHMNIHTVNAYLHMVKNVCVSDFCANCAITFRIPFVFALQTISSCIQIFMKCMCIRMVKREEMT